MEKADMRTNAVVKGKFGVWEEQPKVVPVEFGLNMISEQHGEGHCEQHEFDPVRGWTIKHAFGARPGRYSFESLSAVH
jgi:hypothetical protein